MFEWSGAWKRLAVFGLVLAVVMLGLVVAMWPTAEDMPRSWANAPEHVVEQLRRDLGNGNAQSVGAHLCDDLRPGGRRAEEARVILDLFRDHDVDVPPRGSDTPSTSSATASSGASAGSSQADADGRRDELTTVIGSGG